MNLMLSVRQILGRAAVSALAVSTLAACSEVLDNTGGCPTVCGGQTADVENEVFEAITYDTTVPASIGLGNEPVLYLASMGDSVDTRAIIRFDTIPDQYFSSNDTVSVISVDDSRLLLEFDSAGGGILSPVTVTVYDVTTTGALDDTAVSVLEPLFTGAPLGSRIFPAGTLIDTVSIELDDARVLQSVLTGVPLRLGVSVSSAIPVGLTARAYSDGASTPSISFRPNGDTVRRLAYRPTSKTPADNPNRANLLSDFTLIVKGSPPPPPGDFIVVGGLPAKRGFFRFNIPSYIIDSSIVIRATLELTQYSSDGIAVPSDTLRLLPAVVLAGPLVKDPYRASQILGINVFNLGVSYTTPYAADTAVEVFITGALTRVWLAQDSLQLPRAITLLSASEGGSIKQAIFYSVNHPDVAKRPRLRVSYTPRSRIGTP